MSKWRWDLAFLWAIVIFESAYISGYFLYRISHTSMRQEDSRAYVLFSENEKPLYYFFRPAAYCDARLTGMRFHLGPFEEPRR